MTRSAIRSFFALASAVALAFGCNAILGIDDGEYDGARDAATEAGATPGIDARPPDPPDGAPSDAPFVPGDGGLDPVRTEVRLPRGHAIVLEVKSVVPVPADGKLEIRIERTGGGAVDATTIARTAERTANGFRVTLTAADGAPAPAEGRITFELVSEGLVRATGGLPYRTGLPGTVDVGWGTAGTVVVPFYSIRMASTGRTTFVLEDFENGIALLDDRGTIQATLALPTERNGDGCSPYDLVANGPDRVEVLMDCLLLVRVSAPTLVEAGATVPGNVGVDLSDHLVRVSPDELWIAISKNENANKVEVASTRGPPLTLPDDVVVAIAGFDGGAVYVASAMRRLVRRPDGGAALDPTFGVVSPPGITSFNSLAVGGDGRVVVTANDAVAARMLRYLVDGGLDPTFGDGGVAFNGDTVDRVVAVDRRDRVLDVPTRGRSAVQRHTAKGLPDTSFVKEDAGGGCDETRLALDEDGMILVSCAREGAGTRVRRIWP